MRPQRQAALQAGLTGVVMGSCAGSLIFATLSSGLLPTFLTALAGALPVVWFRASGMHRRDKASERACELFQTFIGEIYHENGYQGAHDATRHL